MEKPNYRLNPVNVDESSRRVVSSVSLRKTINRIEDKTFCFTNCSCDSECSCDENKKSCSCNTVCSLFDPCSHCYCDNKCPCEGVCHCNSECDDAGWQYKI